MSFAEQLRPLIDQLGSTAAAKVCGVTDRTIRLWLQSQGNPNAATQAGAILLLSKAAKEHRRLGG